MKKIILNRLESVSINYSKPFLLTLSLLMSYGAFAQSSENVDTINPLSLFSNTMFNVLLAVIVLLVIIIVVLGSVLKDVASVRLEQGNKNKGAIGIGLFILFMSSSESVLAQTAETTSTLVKLPDNIMYLLLSIIGFELLIILILLSCIKLFVKEEELVDEPDFFEAMNASVAIEREHEIMLDHNYDGIHELDNDLPPWWLYGFYLTIIFAFAYLLNYHVMNKGLLQADEYNTSMQVAALAKEEFQKKNANMVNESNVIILTDKAQIEKGEAIYKENCAACHGKLGEGGVGPNLTDDYWLHGGSIKDVFSSIKYGWPDKGMKSWQADLSPVQIHQISSFIKTLAGTNPPNGKAPQGDLYSDAAIASDSTKTDSTAVILPIDSTSVAKK